jgi:hypothetical protein
MGTAGAWRPRQLRSWPQVTENKKEGRLVTLVWFAIWFISDRIGDREALTFNPVNAWAWTLMLVAALDLSRQHVLARRGD